jgi:hypothetical protein
MGDRLDPWDEALAASLTGGPLLDLDGLEESSGLPRAVLEALIREGLLIPRSTEPEPLFDVSDTAVLAEGTRLLEQGLPLAELLALARSVDAALRPVAEAAVDLFSRYIRDSVEGSSATAEEASNRLVEAFETMLPAAARLVGYHFRRLVSAAALRRIDPDA